MKLVRYLSGLVLFFACASSAPKIPVNHPDWSLRSENGLDERAFPISYQVELQVIATQKITGMVRVQVELQRDLDGLWMHAANLSIDSINVETRTGSIPVDWELFPERELLLLKFGTPVATGTIDLSFRYSLKRGNSRGIATQIVDGLEFLSFSAKDQSGRFLAPSFDQRKFPAEISFSVRVAGDRSVLGGGFKEGEGEVVFRRSLATLSDLGFVIGNFKTAVVDGETFWLPATGALQQGLETSQLRTRVRTAKAALGRILQSTGAKLLVFDRALDLGVGVAVLGIADSSNEILLRLALAHAPTRWGEDFRQGVVDWLLSKAERKRFVDTRRSALPMLVSWYGDLRFLTELALTEAEHSLPVFGSASEELAAGVRSSVNVSRQQVLFAKSECAEESNHKLLLSSSEENDSSSLPICFRYGDRKNLGRECLWHEKKETSHKLALKYCPSWLMMNADGVGFFRTNYPESIWRELTVASLPLATTERKILLDDASWFVGRGQLPPKIALDLLARYARSNKPELWVTAARSAETLGGVVPEDVLPRYKRWISRLFTRAKVRSRKDALLRSELREALSTLGVFAGKEATKAKTVVKESGGTKPALCSKNPSTRIECARIGEQVREYFSQKRRL